MSGTTRDAATGARDLPGSAGRHTVRPDSDARARARRYPVHPILRTARPTQWLKNLLVLAAPGAAGVLDEPRSAALAALAFGAMCLASSGAYFWNDVLDVDADRSHPTKSRRPVAAGELGSTTARSVGAVLVVGSLVLASLTGRWETVALVAVYIVLSLSYSAVWKHVAVLDLLVLAAGFVLRAAVGAAAVGVSMSWWFVLVTSFGALFVAVGKRYAEARQLGDRAREIRVTLGTYSERHLRVALGLSAGGALLSYGVWAFEAGALASSDLPLHELSIVPLSTAFVRYGLVLDQGHGAAPEEVFVRDQTLRLVALSWLVVVGFAVYA